MVHQRTLGQVLTCGSEDDRTKHLSVWKPPYSVLYLLDDPRLLANTVLQTKGIVLDAMIEDRQLSAAATNTQSRGILEDLRVLQGQYRDAAAKSADDGELTKLELKISALERKLARDGSRHVPARRALRVNYEHVQRRLPEDSALIEFFTFEHYKSPGLVADRYGAVVITKTGEPFWVRFGLKRSIDLHVRQFRDGLVHGGDRKHLGILARGFYGEFWGKTIKPRLPAGIKRIFIAPDGEMNFMPFAALVSPEEKFLCEEVEVVYLSTGRDLLRRPSRAASAKDELVFFGNPDFGAGSSGLFRALPGTATEGEHLKALVPKLDLAPRFFTGTDASENNLRSVERPAILHLATHGFYLDSLPFPSESAARNPMFRSGVALAGAADTVAAWQNRSGIPDSASDGILMADEAGVLSLRGTNLVCLSACETVQGEARGGLGVFGLRRGFSKAGARNILMTLWPVADRETASMMKDLYAALAEGSDSSSALAQMQRKWLVRLRTEKNDLDAIRIAGPFVMSSWGIPGE